MSSINELVEGLKIVAWDIILIGDGSGSGWGREVGWASVSLEKTANERLVWVGAANRGTVNFAEIMAYLHPLTYFAAKADEKRKAAGGRTIAYNVHVVTDSQYCRDTGRTRSAMTSKNTGLWACLSALGRQGLVLHWHWLRRDTNAENVFCDKLSRLARLWIAESNLEAKAETDGQPPDVT